MCDCCATTLKKNQVKKHIFDCRGAKVFTCIDCSQDFSGQELDKHVSCKSEAEKYFGKFNQEKKNSGKEKVEVKVEVKEKWKGWRNEIKKVLMEAGGDGIECEEAEKKLTEKYGKCFGKNKGLSEVFKKKANFKRFICIGDRIFYYRYLTNE